MYDYVRSVLNETLTLTHGGIMSALLFVNTLYEILSSNPELFLALIGSGILFLTIDEIHFLYHNKKRHRRPKLKQTVSTGKNLN